MTKATPSRSRKSITAWRVEQWTPTARVSPFGGPRAGEGGEPVFDGGPTFAVDDVRNVVNYLRSLEHGQRWQARHESDVPKAEAADNRLTRLVVLEGKLRNPEPPPPLPGGGRLVPISADGRAGLGAAISAAFGVEIFCLAIQGDPAGTWRGTFTPRRVVLELWPGDPEDLYAHLAPRADRVTVLRTGDPAHRMSALIRRYAASGRTDGRWWTDAP